MKFVKYRVDICKLQDRQEEHILWICIVFIITKFTKFIAWNFV